MTREEALKVLEMFLHKQCDLERTKFAYDANTVWEAVNIANKALEQEPKPQWIPCSERLPDKYGRYLTTHACSLAYEVRTNVWVNRDPSYWLFGEGPVIAWMEMPKPYKAESEDKMTIEEAIADIRDNIKPVVGGKSLDIAIEVLEQTRWIPCSKRLPPLGEEVLVWAYERCYLLTLYAYPNDEGYYWSVGDYDIADAEFDKVIAWMPLPKYKDIDD